jgi:HK97 family phage prohead protease
MNHLYPALCLKSCEDDGTFSGYASVFNNIDLQQEAIAKGAFSKSLYNWQSQNKMPKMLWQHDPKSPIGRWLDIYEDQHGLFVKGQLLLDVCQGREAYALLKAGILDGLSIGFQVVKALRQDKGRVLQEVDLHEISLVTFAANPKAKITSHKDWLNPYAVVNKLVQRLNDLQGMMSMQELLQFS